MADILQTGAAWLTEMNTTHRGRTVTYKRGDTTASVPAVSGRTVFEVPTDFGVYEKVQSSDYLITVAALAAFDEPLAGDQVRDTIGDTTHIFEVMAPGPEPVFRYTDAARRTFRIHTKRVGEVT